MAARTVLKTAASMGSLLGTVKVVRLVACSETAMVTALG